MNTALSSAAASSAACPVSAVHIPNVGEMERWLSIGSGALLAGYGLSRGTFSGIVATAIGGGLVYRGLSGHCHLYESLGMNTKENQQMMGVPAQQGVKIEKSFETDWPAHDLYDVWKDLEHLPSFFSHLKSVKITGENHSHWIAAGPLDHDIEWDAEVFVDHEGELISWRSLPGGDIQTAGSIHFMKISDERTQVSISLKYNPPGGKVGDWIASWMGDGLEQVLDQDIEAFQKSLAGERGAELVAL